MSEQFGLFDDVAAIDAAREHEARRLAKLARFRAMVLERDCCTGYREELWAELPWEPADGERRRRAYRCGRCGEPEATWAASLSHDAGYCGCYGTDPILTGKDVLGNVLDEGYVPPEASECSWCGSVAKPGTVCPWSIPCPTCGAPSGHPAASLHRPHPDCARCGHAWGTHAYMRVGDTLPEEAHCIHYCGCEGYVAPEGHMFPWDEEGG